MESRSLGYLAGACGGELVLGSSEALFSGVGTDTRSLSGGVAFFALVGDRFDGHDFLREAERAGVAAVVVERGREIPDGLRVPVVRVGDTRKALGDLARVWRRELELPVVAVGGSNGKTTTKELLGSVLASRWKTVMSAASFNNDIGVPLTLLRLGAGDEAAVVEVGSNHPGELRPLLGMVKPGIGVVTSIGREHLEHFGSLEGVVKEEGEVAESIPEGGILVVNGDSPLIGEVAKRTRARVLRVGFGSGNDWRARVEGVGFAGSTFRLEGAGEGLDGNYRVPMPGRHQVNNALLAMAVGSILGLGREELSRGLEGCPQPARRMQVIERDGVRILDDCYNANPDSMLAALETLGSLPCEGRRLALLGDMAEVGVESDRLHGEVGRCAGEFGVDLLWVTGRMANWTADAAREAGVGQVEIVECVEAVAERVVESVLPGDILLVKASRSARLERVIDALCNRVTAA